MNCIKKSPVLWGLNLGKVIRNSQKENPIIHWVKGSDVPDLLTMRKYFDEVVADGVPDSFLDELESRGIVVRTLIVHSPVKRMHSNVRIFESSTPSYIENIPGYKRRLSVSALEELNAMQEKQWYILRLDHKISDFVYTETSEDENYLIKYRIENEWLFSCYEDKRTP